MSGSTGLIVPNSVFFGYSKLHLLVLSSKVKLGDLGLAQCSVDRERDLVAWQTNSCFKGRNNGENTMYGNLWSIHCIQEN